MCYVLKRKMDIFEEAELLRNYLKEEATESNVELQKTNKNKDLSNQENIESLEKGVSPDKKQNFLLKVSPPNINTTKFKRPRQTSTKKRGSFSYKIYQTLNKNSLSSISYEVDGFLYERYSSKGEKIYVKCKNKSCKIKGVVFEEKLHICKTIHNHEKETKEIKIIKFWDEISKIVRDGCFKTEEAYSLAIDRVPEARYLLPYENINCVIYRVVNNEKAMMADANSDIFKFADFLHKRYEIYGKIFKKSIINKEKNTCSIIFANEKVCKEISNDEILIDGSYKVHFKNTKNYLLIISVNRFSHKCPCFFALMNNFSKDEVVKVLTVFRNTYAPNILKISTDFNGQLLDGIVEVYNCPINISLFHYICNIFEKLTAHELEINNPVVLLLFNFLCVLPLFPGNLINSVFQYIEEKSKSYINGNSLDHLFSYIKTFIEYVTPDVLSNYGQLSWINEDVLELYQMIHSIFGVNSKYEYLEFTDKLIELQEHISNTNPGNLNQVNLNLLKYLWDINNIHVEQFLYLALPIGKLMLKILLTLKSSQEVILNKLITFDDVSQFLTLNEHSTNSTEIKNQCQFINTIEDGFVIPPEETTPYVPLNTDQLAEADEFIEKILQEIETSECHSSSQDLDFDFLF